MDVLLYISIAWLSFTSFVLLRNWYEFKSLDEAKKLQQNSGKPFVSICIPARNEEEVIERCVTSALKQDYPSFEVLVLDDNSSDRTPEILAKLSGIIANVRLIRGKPKPDDWLGKPWACQQLGNEAKGTYLVFIDADVWLEENALTKTAAVLQDKDTVTVWPQQHFGTFMESLVIPLIYHALHTLLPARYVERKPRWLPERLHQRLSPEFAAACGQFFAFKKSAYNKIGGHASVKNEIVEDVALARELKKNKLGLSMRYGTGTVHCRMYTGHKELWQGLRKNFFAGFNYNGIFFIMMALLHLIVFVIPFITGGIAIYQGDMKLILLSGIPILLLLLQRWVLDLRFKWNPLVSILHPLSVLWYQALSIRCLTDYLTGEKALWKGREL